MNAWQSSLVLVLLFALRCLLPVVVMLLIGYGMNKLSARLVINAQRRQEADEELVRLFGSTWPGKDCETPADCKAFHNPAIPAWLAQQRVCGCRKPDDCLCSPFYHVVPV
jgi:hypothetical protein